MNISIFNTNDFGGAGKAALALADALLDKQHKVSFYSISDESKKNFVVPVLKNSLKKKYQHVLAANMNKRFFDFVHPKGGYFFSNNMFGVMDMSDIPREELIHLHWINSGFISLDQLKTLRNRKFVWTLHDMWAMTGGCHYNDACLKYLTQCETCFQIKSRIISDTAQQQFDKKYNVFRKLDFEVITCSNWLGRLAAKSPLLEGKKINVIGNTLDEGAFKVLNKQCSKKMFQLRDDQFVIGFAAEKAIDNKRKGIDKLLGALQKYEQQAAGREIVLLMCGSDISNRQLGLKSSIVSLGNLRDNYSLALFYNACDVFVAPSIQDNLPNSILESLACGTPVVAFKTGGIGDLVNHKINGYLSHDINEQGLIEGMDWISNCTENDYKCLSAAARHSYEQNFSNSVIAKKHLEVYERIS